MAEQTGIEWTHHTWSPWWGCTKVSDGCKNCYADTLSNRWGFKIWGPQAERRFFGAKHWHDPLRWNRKAEELGQRRRVFPSMCDPFEDRPDLIEPRKKMFELIDATPWLDWLLLTKRPQNILAMWEDDRLCIGKDRYRHNVWLLTSVENQATADTRIPELLKCRHLTPILGLSAEPLLGPINLQLTETEKIREGRRQENNTYLTDIGRGLDWIIAGGESQTGARPMHPDWARGLRDQCQKSGTPFFFKQWGEFAPCEMFPAGSHELSFSGRQITCVTINGRVVGAFEPGEEPVEMMVRPGKKLTGSELDGREWKEFPEVRLEV